MAFQWLLNLRQRDGGWAIPLRTTGHRFDRQTLESELLAPDINKPASHLVTGVVLRAFAAHPYYRTVPEAQIAAELLAARFFSADHYTDRREPDFWLRFSFPFWFTDLLSSLDSLSLLGFSSAHPRVRLALDWFAEQQKNTGVWNLSIVRGAQEPDRHLWISLAICRVFKRLYWNETRDATSNAPRQHT